MFFCACLRCAATAIAAQAQQVLGTEVNNTLSLLRNASTSNDSSTQLTVALTNLATVALRTAVIDCALMSCGEGRCVLVDQQPSCDCAGTGMAGLNCNINSSVAGKPAFGAVDAGVGQTNERQCPSQTVAECSGNGDCIVPCADSSRANCAPYCK